MTEVYRSVYPLIVAPSFLLLFILITNIFLNANMANKMEMRNACTHMSCQLETHKIFYFFVSVSFFMRNTQIQQQRNQHEPSQKQKIEHTSWPKRMGEHYLYREGNPKMEGREHEF